MKTSLITGQGNSLGSAEFEIDTNIKSVRPEFHMISNHVNIQINSTTRQYDFVQFHIGQFCYQASCKGCPIFLQSPLLFHLSTNFIFSQTCISHHSCEKYSNLWYSDKWKMDLQVKKLNVDISATPRKICHWSLSSPQDRNKLLIPPVKGED